MLFTPITMWTRIPQEKTTPMMSLAEPSGTGIIFLSLLLSDHGSVYEQNTVFKWRKNYLICVCDMVVRIKMTGLGMGMINRRSTN